MLDNFFKINLPYGIDINEDGSLTPFNREYSPIGYAERDQLNKVDRTPISTHYKGLSEKLLISLAHHPVNGVRKDEKGKITTIWFYNDGTNPGNDPKHWSDYLSKMKKLGRLKSYQPI